MKRLIPIGFLVFTGLAFGQKSMDFEACRQLALEKNLEIKLADIGQETAKYQYKASYGKLAPTLNTNGFERTRYNQLYNFQSNSYVDNTEREFRGTVRGTFNLFAGFNVINSIKMQKNEYAIAQVSAKQVAREITISLAEKYITILYLQELIQANDAQIQASEKQLNLAQLKFEAGVIAESEVFKLKSQKASEELELLSNQNKLTENWIGLKQLLNLPITEELVLLKPAIKLDQAVTSATNSFEIANRALELHPLNSLSVFKEKKAKAALAVARSNRYPTINLVYLYRTSYFSTNELVSPALQFDRNRNGFLRFNLMIPIFNQLTTFSKIKVAKGAYKQALVNTELVRNQTTKEIMKAITDTKTAVKKLEASSVAFDYSKKSFEADALKFELGKININELNTTKKAYSKAQTELIQSNYELMYNNALINFYLGEEFKL
jgi:outer membrane protein TolC